MAFWTEGIVGTGWCNSTAMRHVLLACAAPLALAGLSLALANPPWLLVARFLPREASDLISKIRSCTVRSDLRNKVFFCNVLLISKIRSYSGRSDLRNKIARFSGYMENIFSKWSRRPCTLALLCSGHAWGNWPKGRTPICNLLQFSAKTLNFSARDPRLAALSQRTLPY